MSYSESTQNLLDSKSKIKKENASKWDDLRVFFWNSDTKELLGKDKTSWIKTTIFHASFYAGLLTFFAVLLAFFSLTIDEINPTLQGYSSSLKLIPGMAFRPVPDHKINLIRFIQGKPGTYKVYTDHLQAFLKQYENEQQVGENFIDCSMGKPPESENKVCRFNVDQLGNCTWQKDFGYDEGEPCILLKLNKLFMWRAQPYTSLDEFPPNIRDLVRDRWKPDHIPVTCEGRYDADVENIGNVTFFPAAGFPAYFWPYKNQEGFRTPLIMARFNNPANGVLIYVICKAWGRNILHHANDQLGLTTFELLVD